MIYCNRTFFFKNFKVFIDCSKDYHLQSQFCIICIMYNFTFGILDFYPEAAEKRAKDCAHGKRTVRKRGESWKGGDVVRFRKEKAWKTLRPFATTSEAPRVKAFGLARWIGLHDDEVKYRLISPIRARAPNDRSAKYGKHNRKTAKQSPSRDRQFLHRTTGPVCDVSKPILPVATMVWTTFQGTLKNLFFDKVLCGVTWNHKPDQPASLQLIIAVGACYQTNVVCIV